VKTIDMSGFGGGYEEACQQMLTNGLVYLARVGPHRNLKYGELKNVYGLCIAESDEAKALDKAIMTEVYKVDDASGAMHQAAVSHLMYIVNNGYEKYIEVGREREERDKEKGHEDWQHICDYEDEAREKVLDKFPWPKPEEGNNG